MYDFDFPLLCKVDNMITKFCILLKMNVLLQYLQLVMWYLSNINECLQLYSIDEFECASNPCLNGATCMETFGSFYCSCPQGWTGPRCNEGRDYILSSCSLEYCKPNIV